MGSEAAPSREELLGSTCSGLTAAVAAVSNGADLNGSGRRARRAGWGRGGVARPMRAEAAAAWAALQRSHDRDWPPQGSQALIWLINDVPLSAEHVLYNTKNISLPYVLVSDVCLCWGCV